MRILNSSTLWNHPDSFPLRFPPARKLYLLQVEGMGSLPVVLLLCSFHGNAAKQNTQIILFNYGWVAVCLFLCCKTLPSCGFCSTALTAVAQTQQAGNTLLLISHTLDQDDFCCTTSVHLWVIAMGYWEDVFLIWSCFFFPPVVSRDRWGTWRHLANQWVTAYWKWPLNCLSGGPTNCRHSVLCASSHHCVGYTFNMLCIFCLRRL